MPNRHTYFEISELASSPKLRRRWGRSCGAQSARAAAYGDIDNDGYPDLLLTTNAGPAYLFHNEGGSNHSLRIKLVGTKSNRDGIGAVVRLSDKQWKMLRSGSSYLSQSELVLTFGLGTQTKVDAIEIQWPSGQTDHLSNVNAGQMVTVQEGTGIVNSRPYSAPHVYSSQLNVAKR